MPGLKLGRFTLTKHLPVAAGVGGGSADAAAALRLLARANGRARRSAAAARPRGRSAPTCRSASIRARALMRGIGEMLSTPLEMPQLAAVLVNPGVALPTKDVFAALHRAPWQARSVH